MSNFMSSDDDFWCDVAEKKAYEQNLGGWNMTKKRPKKKPRKEVNYDIFRVESILNKTSVPSLKHLKKNFKEFGCPFSEVKLKDGTKCLVEIYKDLKIVRVYYEEVKK